MIERNAGAYDVTCDACPAARERIETRYMRDAATILKSRGWKIVKIGPGWHDFAHLCPVCKRGEHAQSGVQRRLL